MAPTLPDGFTIRPPELDESDAIDELILACAIAEDGTDTFTVPYRQSDWELPGFQRETDAWVVWALDGQMAGYGSVWQGAPGRFGSEGYVYPDFSGRGIGKVLLRLIEERAGQLAQSVSADLPVTLMQRIGSKNDAARHLLEAHGFGAIRYEWRMVIELSEAPPAPIWPVGIKVRKMIAGQDERAIYEAAEEAVAEQRGYVPVTFEQWAQTSMRPVYFEPNLWFLATDGPEIAGVVLCRYQRGMGWVGLLAVRKAWRKQGLGMALLRQAFGEFYRQGRHKVGLNVDSENETGAARLYQRAGMHVARQRDRYVKELRS